MFDVVAIGSATRDNFLRVDYDLVDSDKSPSHKAIALPFGEKLEVEDVFTTIGGNAANAAVTFGRQGFKTACAAKIGIDPSGEALKNALKKDGVNTKHLSETRDKRTAYSVLLLQGGERTILGYHGASGLFSVKDLNLKKLKAKWWYISLSGASDAMYLPLVKFAKENGIKIAFNPSGYHIRDRKEEVLESLKDIDFFVVNSGEAADLVGIPFDEEEKVFEKLDELVTPGIVAITIGPSGVSVSDGKKIYKAGVFQEREVADRTGAGDAFGSGFTAILARGGSVPEAIRFASANATSVVEHLGTTPGILTKKEFETSERWKDLQIKS